MTTDQTDAGLALASPEGVLREVLEREYGGGQALNATLVLAALTAAGYAVVRLPEPDGADEDLKGWEVAPPWVYVTSITTTGIDASVELDCMDPDTARALAAALLAAADHQEKNQ